ncbi:MAG: penicillin-binding protein 1B [Cellvibrionales bacterium]|nr:penicillin-binding protein 1B [Cellvibrionales bacterium]
MPNHRPSPRRTRRKHPARNSRRWWVSLLIFTAKCAAVVIPFVLLASVYVDSLVRNKFEGRKWTIPAKVYAKPLELYPGQPFSAKGMTDALTLLGYQASSAAGFPGQYRQTGDSVEMHTRGFAFADQPEPSRHVRLDFNSSGITQIYDKSGKTLPLLRLEPLMIGSLYSGKHDDRLLVKLEDVPPVMLAGLVATEDRYFMNHHGISLRGILRALWINISAGGLVQGGSTITQQLVKNFYLNSERTLSRKILEVWMSVLLEVHYSKREILETYINEVYFGQEGGRSINGFGLASQQFFRQPLNELKLHQMALLIGMVKGPSYYNPWRNPERATERRRVVLGTMLDQGVISQAEYDWADKQALGVGSGGQARIGVYPAFLELVRRQLNTEYKDEDLLTEGLKIFTTIDPQVQWLAEQALQNGINKLENTHKSLTAAKGQLQGAVVVTNPTNGEVVALVGDRTPKFSGFNRAIDANRPVGSLLKPFIFLSALESGKFSLATQVDDSPLSWRNANGSWWRPQNYDGKSHGNVSLLETLAHSYNLATARVGLQVGVKPLVQVIRRAGVQSELDPVPSLLLGAGGMSPLEVARLYQMLASGGFTLPIRTIRDVYTAEGKPIKRYGLEMEQTVDAAYTQEITWAMQAVLREGTARAAYDRLPFGLRLAGKTGTTDSQRDSWFAGFSGNYNTVVWVGRDDNQKMPLTGATGALPIWISLMASLPNQTLPEPSHANIEWQWIDEASGNRTDEGCSGASRMPIDRRSPQPAYVSCRGRSPVNLLDQFLGH